MDRTASQGVLVNVARFSYALVGFSLSVITAFYGLFRRPKPKPHNELLPLLGSPQTSPLARARSRRPRRTLSEPSVKFAPLPPSRNEKQPSEPSEKQTIDTISPLVIPVITVDPSTPVSPKATDILKLGIQFEEPLSEVPPTPPPYTSRSSTSSSTCSSGSEKAGFRLFHKKTWNKEGKDRPKVERRQSSPHILCQGPLAPLLPGLCPRPPRNPSDSTPLKKSKSRKTLRSVASVPALVDEKTPTKKRTLRRTEKKRSQVLRTQPYEAPYFCTPPTVPSTPVHQRSLFPDSTASGTTTGD